MARGHTGFDDDENRVVFNDCVATGETASKKALFVRVPSLARTICVPKSQIHDDSEVFDLGDHASGQLAINRWLAEKEGWDGDE